MLFRSKQSGITIVHNGIIYNDDEIIPVDWKEGEVLNFGTFLVD